MVEIEALPYSSPQMSAAAGKPAALSLTFSPQLETRDSSAVTSGMKGTYTLDIIRFGDAESAASPGTDRAVRVLPTEPFRFYRADQTLAVHDTSYIDYNSRKLTSDKCI